MTVAMEDMKKEMGRLKGHIVSQGEELLRIKRATVGTFKLHPAALNLTLAQQ